VTRPFQKKGSEKRISSPLIVFHEKGDQKNPLPHSLRKKGIVPMTKKKNSHALRPNQ